MNKNKELAVNTLVLSIGKICTQFVSFLLLPLYTAFLTPDEYGIVDLLNTYVLLLVPIFNWQFESGLFRFMIDYRESKSQQVKLFSTVLATNVFQIITYLIIYLLIQPFIHIDLKIFLAWDVCINIFLNTLLQFSRGLGKNSIYSLGSFLSASLTVILNVIFIAGLKFGAFGLCLATLLAKIITCIYLFLATKCWDYFSIKSFNKSMFKELAKYSAPLVPNSISWWIINASDRTIITAFLGMAANGIYTVANKFSAVYSTFFNIFNLAWTESVSVHINDDDREKFINKTINSVFILFSTIGFGIISCMPFVFNILINERYEKAFFQIPILIFGIIFQVMMGLFSTIYIGFKKSKELAKSTFYAAVINIVIDVLLIKKIGLYAASISTLCAFGVVAVNRYFDIRKYMNVSFTKKTIVMSVIMSAITLSTYYSNEMIFHIFGLVVVLFYAIYSNISFLRFIHIEIKKRMLSRRGKNV